MSNKSSPESLATEAPATDQRVVGVTPFTLVELDPQLVIEGELVVAGLLTDEVTPVGKMRETCPACSGVALQLVLPYPPVLRAHLYCPQCTRCFDALYPDGRSALLTPGPSIE